MLRSLGALPRRRSSPPPPRRLPSVSVVTDRLPSVAAVAGGVATVTTRLTARRAAPTPAWRSTLAELAGPVRRLAPAIGARADIATPIRRLAPTIATPPRVAPHRLLGSGVVAAATTIGGELLYVTRRPLPSFTDLDPSGTFGSPDLPSLRIVAVGDSTMTGPGLDDPDDLWLRVVARRLAAHHHVELHSLARGGSRTDDLLREQLDRAVALSPDIAIVSIGGNDILHLVPIWRFERRLDAIVGRLAEASGAVVLFGIGDLGTIPRATFVLRHWVHTAGRLGDQVHERVAARHGVDKVDQWQLTTAAFRAGRHMFSADLFHPSAIGHRTWADAVWPTLERAVAQVTTPGRDA